ncbi:MAG: hypothetical protein HQL30_00415 [Candidatus Omnitrophica bacterium]|nr:hypothetical protein [Candidatus Omnitrophota bacterium]
MNEKEFWGFLEEENKKGRIDMVSGTMDGGGPRVSQTSNYICGHVLLPKDYDKIPQKTMIEMGKLLFDPSACSTTKEAILIILAHQTTKDALFLLEEYAKNPDPGLDIFARLALDECYMWNE